MEPRWCSLPLVALLFFSALNICVYYHNQPNLTTTTPRVDQYFISTIQSWLQTYWSSTTTSTSTNHDQTPFGPNMSKCHGTFTDLGVPVNCCHGLPPHVDQATAIDFQLPVFTPSQVRVRRPLHLITDEAYIAKFQRAMAIIKTLPAENPHSFYRQASLHCLYCTGSYNQLGHDDTQFKIHRNWLFFPWHRAYLYFQERILAKLVGDDMFALPYWNWDVPGGMEVPRIYMNGSLWCPNRERTHFPPSVMQHDYAGPESGLCREDQIEVNLALLYTQFVSAARLPELFMGCIARPGEQGFCDGPGTMELVPHNPIHWWTGDSRNPERQDMGAFYSAGRDPLFYVHHTNIDRIWSVWKKTVYGNKLEFDDPTWLDAFFYFHDENQRLIKIKVRDVLELDKLGYQYETIDLPWLNAKPKPSVDPKISRPILKSRVHHKFLHGTTGRHVLKLNEAFTVRVDRPRKFASSDVEEVLVVDGIDVEKNLDVKLDVFVNLADDATAVLGNARWREFAGSYVSLRRMTMHGSNVENVHMKSRLKIGISELLRDLEADGDDRVWVTVVRRGNNYNTSVAIDGIRIELMPVDRSTNVHSTL